eukprot:NODE_1151_length_1077_cov_190.973735_g889_i0.p1 GENE.NODE_1151_length_1077_cov_190.973735_g889_i0~~NODE_1151_length_1077_cov_190.973735_g889_i0.p1  ORF type:complete len:224 (-),score=36.15 NODE_1151_length_1077_cov_190.973735_g889_i0:345-1016(-)
MADAFIQDFKAATTTEDRNKIFAAFEDTHPSKEAVAEFYNTWGEGFYNVDMVNESYHNPASVCEEVCQLGLEKTVSILDAGAGTGAGGQALAAAGFSVIDGIDGSSGMLRKATALGVYRNLFCELIGDDRMQSTPDDSYDLIVSSGSFYPHHLPGSCLPALVRAVKPGGYLVLSSAPHNDEHVGLGQCVQKLKEENCICVIKATYVSKWYHDQDGTMWVLKKK